MEITLGDLLNEESDVDLIYYIFKTLPYPLLRVILSNSSFARWLATNDKYFRKEWVTKKTNFLLEGKRPDEALLYASLKGELNIVKELDDRYHYTTQLGNALMSAIEGESVNVIHYLLSLNSPYVKPVINEAILLASNLGYELILDMLLNSVENISAAILIEAFKVSSGQSIIKLADKVPKKDLSLKFLSLVRDKSAYAIDLLKFGINSRTLQRGMVYAIKTDNLELIDAIFDILPPVDNNYYSAMIEAVKSGNLELIQFLHEHGVSLNGLLTGAATYGYSHIVGYLIKNGVNVQEDDNAPLKAALDSDHIGIAYTLIKNGANGFLEVVSYNDLDLLEYYLGIKAEEGENIADIINSNDGTALSLAADNDNIEILEYLLQNGANVGLEQSLIFAIDNNDEQMVEVLVNYGVNFNRSLAIAKHMGLTNVAKIITKMIKNRVK